MAKLTPKQLENSRSWLYDIFCLNTSSSGLSSIRPSYYYDRTYSYKFVRPQTEIIFNMIKEHPVVYSRMISADDALSALSNKYFAERISSQNEHWIRKHKELLAKYVANFCAENEIYWDDSLSTPYERAEILKTFFGKALWDFKCFVSQGVNTKATKAIKNTSSGNSTTQAAGTAQTGYKSLGPLSSKVTTLVGPANQKITFSYSYVYCIEADKLGTNTPCLFVTPVTSKGGSIQPSKAETVRVGSGNGWSDCKLWWDNYSDASDFLYAWNKTYTNGKFSNFHISKARPDAKGYFKVNTALGMAFIKASKLNEEILEACDTCETEKKPVNKQAYKIQNIDVYSEAFDKYRD